MDKKRILSLALLVLSVILAVVSLMLLPDTVTVQISSSGGSASSLPKLLAVLIPTALGVGFSVAAFFCEGDIKANAKLLFAAGVGVLVFVIMLIVNL